MKAIILTEQNKHYRLEEFSLFSKKQTSFVGQHESIHLCLLGIDQSQVFAHFVRQPSFVASLQQFWHRQTSEHHTGQQEPPFV